MLDDTDGGIDVAFTQKLKSAVRDIEIFVPRNLNLSTVSVMYH